MWNFAIRTKTLVTWKQDITRVFFSVLDAEFERAPINKGMQRFFHEAAFMNDFILMREVLEWVWDELLYHRRQAKV